MRLTFTFLAALLLVPALAGPATAADPTGPVFAGYWGEFWDHWKGVFQRQNGVVMGVLAVGAVALFIVTRGKWGK